MTLMVAQAMLFRNGTEPGHIQLRWLPASLYRRRRGRRTRC
ncbi:MAG: hypothetical protein AAF526_13315 [Pseudomonadota bacterium]